MAGEPAPRRGRAAAAHAPPASVSARALHGGSLPSGVDTSFLLGEEGGARGSYLATVHVVNPPPLAERRVSASDAQPPPADDPAARRSKPTFPMTYTARATLEIGSGSVGSGRAVTTTTASNQVRTARPARPPPAPAPRPPSAAGGADVGAPCGPELGLRSALHRPGAVASRRCDERAAPARDASVCARDVKYIDGADSVDPDRETAEREIFENIHSLSRLDDILIANMPYRNVKCDSRSNGEAVYDREEGGMRRGYKERYAPAPMSTNTKNFTIGDSDEENYHPYGEMKSYCCNRNNERQHQRDKSAELKPEILIDSSNLDTKLRKGKDDMECKSEYIRNNNNDLEFNETDKERDVPRTKLNEIRDIPNQMVDISEESHVNTKTYKQRDPCLRNNERDGIEMNEMKIEKIHTREELLQNEDEQIGVEMREISKFEVKESDEEPLEMRPVSKETNNNQNTFSDFVTSQQNLFKRIENDASYSDMYSLAKREPVESRETEYVSREYDEVSTVSKPGPILTELPNNAYVFLTLPKSFSNNQTNIKEIESKRKAKKRTKIKIPKTESLHRRAVELLLYSDTERKVDSAVPFGCITSPEVVGCGAAPASADPKPRSVISSGYNGLPLSRPADDYKKSLDENGNSVQGSGQPKKPRRKKASKNETVIKSHQIDGYQGNKDLDELLRFIESNDDAGRPKLRAKHKDDCDDKAAKKRSTERRKDRDAKPKRASSLEELSRTTLEDLTDEPAPREPRRAPHAPAKPERRSWGDDARALLARAPAADSDAPELTDFQTVTKKRKPRRRHDDAEREPAPRRARRSPGPRSPRRAPPPSAPASDRSDSNDDMDSLHSQPAAPPPPAPHASYADIARTRHNIPDLIESCNFPAGGGGGARGAGAAAADADQYPALEPRRARDKRPPQPPARAPRAEPDVRADRRPPVVLLDAGARPGDLDGVTFGFDVNEQLLGGPRRARCDLLRDAPEHAPPAARAPPAPRAPCALRYVAPEPPADVTQLHRIIDYISAAWDDVLRCGGGKALYYSE